MLDLTNRLLSAQRTPAKGIIFAQLSVIEHFNIYGENHHKGVVDMSNEKLAKDLLKNLEAIMNREYYLPKIEDDFSDFPAKKAYLLESPIDQVFSVGELRELQDTTEPDNLFIKKLFTKLGRVSLPRWLKISGQEAQE